MLSRKGQDAMAMLFVFYFVGLTVFLGIVYFCVQMGWLFGSGGRIQIEGLMLLSLLLVGIFIFITSFGASQLGNWEPLEQQEAGSGGDRFAVIRSIRKGLFQKEEENTSKINAKAVLEALKDQFRIEGKKASERFEDYVWDDEVSVGVWLAAIQGVTTVKMMVHDIATSGFLNRLHPLDLFGPESKIGQADLATRDKEAFRLDQAVRDEFKKKVEAIEVHFHVKFNLPKTVLPDELRRTEEIYLAITQGKVEYPYLRYEFSLPFEQAYAFAERYEKRSGGAALSLKAPVAIELFGRTFDLGLSVLDFSDARLKPLRQEIETRSKASAVDMHIVPAKSPGKMMVTYEKFYQKKSGDQSIPEV